MRSMAAPYRPPDFHTFSCNFPSAFTNRLFMPYMTGADRPPASSRCRRFPLPSGSPRHRSSCRPGLYQVVPVGLVDAFRHDFRVEDNGASRSQSSSAVCPSSKRKLVRRDVPDGFPEESFAESRFELFATVMVVYAVGEPYAFQVDGECLEVRSVPVAGIVGVEGLQRFRIRRLYFPFWSQSMSRPVSAASDKIIYQFFPGDGKPVEPVHPVTEHLQICKLLVIIGKKVSVCMSVYE